MTAMRTFLADYERGKREGRYANARLPSLPFPDKTFDLALCSHLFFLHSDHLTLALRRAAIAEMCRVAKKVRVFPLRDLGCKESVHLEPIVSGLQETGYEARFVKVDYEFQKGANMFLSIHKPVKEAENVKTLYRQSD
jgi:ubiquinone/menaquinone biosynthesis C-methylase UbiE